MTTTPAATPLIPSQVEPSGLFSTPSGINALVNALVADSGSDVALLDQTGRFVYVAPTVRWWKYPGAKMPLAGKTLHDLLPLDAANERLSLLTRCARERQPMSLVGMWGGIQLRTTLRPVETPDRGTLVLAVCRPFADEPEVASASQPLACNVVMAKWTDRGSLSALTPREVEVLTLIGQGMTTAEIAKTLFRSHKTVEAHRLSLGLKLKAKNRVELARIALRAGLTQHRPTKPTIAARVAALRQGTPVGAAS